MRYVATWGKRLPRAQYPAINLKGEAEQIQVDANILLHVHNLDLSVMPKIEGMLDANILRGCNMQIF